MKEYRSVCEMHSNKILAALEENRDLKTYVFSKYTKMVKAGRAFWKAFDNYFSKSVVDEVLEDFRKKWDFSGAAAANFRKVVAVAPPPRPNNLLPQNLSAFLHGVKPEDKFEASVFYTTEGGAVLPASPTNTQVVKVSGTLSMTAAAFLTRCLEYVAEAEHRGKASPPSLFVLKANGFNEHFVGANRLLHYKYFQHSVYHKSPAELSLCSANSVEYKENTYLPEYVAAHNTCSSVESVASAKIAVQSVALPFSAKVHRLSGLASEEVPEGCSHVSVELLLFFGEERLTPVSLCTEERWLTDVVFFAETLQTRVSLNALPRESKVAFLVWLHREAAGEKKMLFAGVVQQLFDEHGELVHGQRQFGLWPLTDADVGEHLAEFLFRFSNNENRDTQKPVLLLSVEFLVFGQPLFFDVATEAARTADSKVVGSVVDWNSLHQRTKVSLRFLMEADPLYELSRSDKALLWLARHHLTVSAAALPKFLRAVDWSCLDQRAETYSLLREWQRPATVTQALALLTCGTQDSFVRALAVAALCRASDDELETYMLQLTQCVKSEPYHTSLLARLLLARAVQNRQQVGHAFFWALKAELGYAPEFFERFALLLEAFLVNSGDYLFALQRQSATILRLTKVALKIKRLKTEEKASDRAAKSVFRTELAALNAEWLGQIAGFQNPVAPTVFLGRLVVEQCRFFSSKMVPLFLVFENADGFGRTNSLIFKCGDDLRQDALTLQLLRLMNRLWFGHRLDMKLSPYRAIALGSGSDGRGVGVLQAVGRADTISSIQVKFGGSIIGALKVSTLEKYVRHFNAGVRYNLAVKNFTYSCAAYCVATYILGIGDRHNGNIMLKRNGKLFHIDFGHFLGNFKSKYGIKRERAAFVFLPEMAYIMGGNNYAHAPTYETFKQLSAKAFNQLRKHSSVFINLFELMVSAKMPELMKKEDILYLKDMLCLDKTEEEAAQLFKAELYKSLNATSRRFDNLIHNLKHG